MKALTQYSVIKATLKKAVCQEEAEFHKIHLIPGNLQLHLRNMRLYKKMKDIFLQFMISHFLALISRNGIWYKSNSKLDSA